MSTTPAAISLIGAFEGFGPHAYLDPLGIPTIGKGTTRYRDGATVQLGDEISEEDADRELFFHLREKVEPVLESVFGKVDLQPNQRDALASFIYNLGGDADKKYPTLKRLILDGASNESIARQLVEYRNVGTDAELGLYRRRVAEACMWCGVPYDSAFGVELTDDVMDIIASARGNMDRAAGPESVEKDLFEADELTPDDLPNADFIEADEGQPSYWDKLTEPEQTEYLNRHQRAVLTGEAQPPVRSTIAIRPTIRPVEIKNVPYIENPKPKVKPIEASQRGRGYAKTETGRGLGIVATGGTAATAVGAMEPAVKFVDKYPKETIAYVFFGLLIFSVSYYYYGKWQRQKGEDEATDLLA